MLSSGAHHPDRLPGTPAFIVRRTLTAMGPQPPYGIAAGTRALADQAAGWPRSAALVNRLLSHERQ